MKTSEKCWQEMLAREREQEAPEINELAYDEQKCKIFCLLLVITIKFKLIRVFVVELGKSTSQPREEGSKASEK